MIIYHPCKQNTPEWFKLRKGLWTGSKAIRLLQDKPMASDSDWGGNDYTRRGHVLESVAIMEYERKYKVGVSRPGFVTNSAYPNAGYSPDGISGPWLLEIKCLNGRRHSDLANGSIPLPYLVQIYFGMIITGKRKARLIAFNPEFEKQMTVIEIFYDKEVGSNIRKKLRADLKKRKNP